MGQRLSAGGRYSWQASMCGADPRDDRDNVSDAAAIACGDYTSAKHISVALGKQRSTRVSMSAHARSEPLPSGAERESQAKAEWEQQVRAALESKGRDWGGSGGHHATVAAADKEADRQAALRELHGAAEDARRRREEAIRAKSESFRLGGPLCFLLERTATVDSSTTCTEDEDEEYEEEDGDLAGKKHPQVMAPPGVAAREEDAGAGSEVEGSEVEDPEEEEEEDEEHEDDQEEVASGEEEESDVEAEEGDPPPRKTKLMAPRTCG